MRNILVFILLFGFLNANTQELPVGYVSYFQNDFSKVNSLKNLFFTTGTDYSISNGILTLSEKDDSLGYLLPISSMIIDNNIFGEYIVKTRIKYANKTLDSLEGVYFIVAFRDTDNYYFVQLNILGVQFYRKYKGEVFMVDSNNSISFPSDKWVDIIIERDILHRTILLKYNDSITTFTDVNLVMGFFGIGTKKFNLQIDYLNIWAPTSIEQPLPMER